jgi:hypothetical protein
MALLELDRRSRAACLLLLGWLACAVLTGSTSAEVAAAGQVPRALEPGRAAQIAQLIADPAATCLPAATDGDEDGVQPELTQAVRALRVSPVGAWLLEQAAAQDVLICLDPATPLAAYYRSGPRLIGVQAPHKGKNEEQMDTHPQMGRGSM